MKTDLQPSDQTTATTTMRAVVARSYGGPDVLEVADCEVPVPGPGQVLIETGASALNALDWHFLTGTPYFMRLMVGLRAPKRIVHGADVAGTVVAVGAGVERFAVGDLVFGECEGGGLAAYTVTDEDRLAAVPAGVSIEDAAATPVAGLTALQGLHQHAQVQPGERVLINGAAGGVGTFAVQIANAFGAHVTAVCSGRNVEMVRSIGADVVIDYEREALGVEHGPFDVVFDNVGNHPARRWLELLEPHGRYVIITGPKKNRLLGPVPRIVGSALRFAFAKQTLHQFTAQPNASDLEMLGKLLGSGKVVPQIHRVIDLDGVAEAMAQIGTGHTPAKIVVRPG